MLISSQSCHKAAAVLGLTSSVQSLSCVWLFAAPWTAACQASLSITSPRSLLKLMSIESVMPSNHLILCRPLLLPPWIFPSTRDFSNESVFRIRWLKHWSFSFSISPSSGYSKMSLLFNMLSRLVVAFLPRSKRLLISWLQSPSAVILEPKKVSHCFHYFPSICHEMMGLDGMILVFWMLSFKPVFFTLFHVHQEAV